MQTFIFQAPEAVIAQAELLAKIENRDLNEILIDFLTNYIENSLNSIVNKKEASNMTITQRNDITLPMIESAYQVAKEVYKGSLTRTEGKKKVNQLSSMGEGSAQDYITNFLAMMSGETYTRTMSTIGTDYFLRNIFKDFGVEQFKTAILSTRKHLEYYATVSPTKSPKRANLLKKLEHELL